MSQGSTHPLPRLHPDGLDRLAEAAGFAPACAFESSQEWHAALVQDWRRRLRRSRLNAISPSITSLCLALVLVVM